MMFKLRSIGYSLAIYGLSQVAVAQAASLSGVQGEVLVDAGAGLKPVVGAASLKVGDTVVAQKGSGQITYPDGCQVPVDPGASVTIGEKSPCQMASQSSPTAPTVAAGGLGTLGGLGTTGLIVGGVAVIGGVAAIASNSKDDKKKPASP